jgi:hypothetical protein
MPVPVQCSRLSCVFVQERILIDLFNEQEGAEEELENNEDGPDDVVGAEVEDKENEKKARERKTTKYMTKYERARILGTRALQIRYVSIFLYLQPQAQIVDRFVFLKINRFCYASRYIYYV